MAALDVSFDELEGDDDFFEDHFGEEVSNHSSPSAASWPAKKAKTLTKKNKSPKNPYPWSDDIYVTIKHSEVGGKKSTEEGFRPIWHHWAAFCKANNKEPIYVNEFGLQLHSERQILDPTVEVNKVAQQLYDLNYDAQKYDAERIVAFFAYLVELADPPVT
jgi:hypothetical protein